MRIQQTLTTLHGLTADQWGLFTTAQAKTRGVSGMDLQRATRSGQIESVRHGVYRLAGMPHEPIEQLRAAWLGLEPARMAYQRLDDQDPVVVMGPTATWVHQVGDLQPQPYYFAAPSRRQSRDPEIRCRRRDTSTLKTRLIDGLPVTTLEQTITDLVREHLDLSLVADALSEAALQEGFDLDLLHQLLAADAPGTEAVLLRLAGLDTSSMVQQLMSTDVGNLLRQAALQETWKTLSGSALAQYRLPEALLQTLRPKLQLGGISQDLLGVTKVMQGVKIPPFPIIPPGLLRALTLHSPPSLPVLPARKATTPDQNQEVHRVDTTRHPEDADTAAASPEAPDETPEENAS